MGSWTLFDEFFERNQVKKEGDHADNGIEAGTHIVETDCSESGS